ncbi:MAG: alanine--tRNA ligase, partial [Alphaproteobacteria bacterium]|nr:alanine--tRNA ligase [Alphaproteobacteria bacterium]
MASTNDIRDTFLNYFKDNDHEVVPSSPLVPRNDPTLMFTNAGMVQFKNVFTGAETRDYVRAATSQKCVRAGGKHNDLENVGYTGRHHTFFEMLGNFSFGDYFKERAIELAWNLITAEFGLPAEKLLITVFAEDEEAGRLWRKISGLGDDRVIPIATSDNFWAMGATGPCGPCSEIFYDHGPGIPGGPPGSAEEGGDRFVEIWNLVFMQYEQMAPGERVDLPRPSIDTGMGLERMAAILQGQHDNYDTDTFKRLIETSAQMSGTPATGENAVSHRVIADHLRACSFLMADGVMPSNAGRGYVLRRIMRRAMRHAHILGCSEPLMHRLVPSLVAEMGVAYPELARAEAMVRETFRIEEERFKKTLERGLKLLAEETRGLGDGGELAGDVAFKLYDTYGFPLDLTQDILRGQNQTVDQAGFDAGMERQRAAAREAWAGSGDAATEEVWFDIRDGLGATEFVGYEMEAAEGEIRAIVKNGARVEAVELAEGGENDDAQVAIVVNQTPFYGESGGQEGDHGEIAGPQGAFAVTNTQKKLGDLHVHLGQMTAGRLAVGDEVALQVDQHRRTRLRANHSATHLLHQALRETLGDHV